MNFLQYLCDFMLINATNAQIKPFWHRCLGSAFIYSIHNSTAIQCIYFLVAQSHIRFVLSEAGRERI